MAKDTTYVLTNRGWAKSKGFESFESPYHFGPAVFLTGDGLQFCQIEFSYA